MGRARIDTELPKQERMLKLLVMLVSSRAPIPLDTFKDENSWGDERTFQRTRAEVNQLWERLRGCPLFQIVDAEGRPARRGKRFLKLVDADVDRDISLATKRSLVSMIAGWEFLRLIQGTILGDEFKQVEKKLNNGLSSKDRRWIAAAEKKFHYVGKGIKDYSVKSDLLDEIYDALLKEHLLEVSVDKDGELKTYIFKPLSLVMFNNGLYLVVQFENQPEEAKPYIWRVERFVTAKCLKKSFKYPAQFNPEDLFTGAFGLISGEDPIPVSIVFENEPGLHTYLLDRGWTPDTRFEHLVDGRLRMSFSTTDLTEVIPFVLGFGASAEVLEPRDLRDEVAEHHKLAAEKYA